MGKRVVLMVAAWLAGAAAAAVGVTAALSFLGTGLFGTSSAQATTKVSLSSAMRCQCLEGMTFAARRHDR